METKARYVELISDFPCERCPCDADVSTKIGNDMLNTFLCADCAIFLNSARLEAVFIEMGGTTEQYENVFWDVVTNKVDELIGFSAQRYVDDKPVDIEIDGVLIEIKRVGINKVKGE